MFRNFAYFSENFRRMDPKKKLAQLDGLVAGLIIGQNRLVEQVTIMGTQMQHMAGQIQQLVEFQKQSLEFQKQTLESQKQSMEFQKESMQFQSRMSMQLGGIHDFMRQMSGEFQDLKEDNKRLSNLETRVRTLETIVLKAS